jgi:hypothetical protein
MNFFPINPRRKTKPATMPQTTTATTRRRRRRRRRKSPVSRRWCPEARKSFPTSSRWQQSFSPPETPS